MKINVEIDVTPEEARRFLGLPDVTKANDIFVDTVAKAMKGVTSVDQLQDYAKQIAPMGQMGLKLFQQFMDNGGASAFGGFGGSGKGKKKPSDDQ